MKIIHLSTEFAPLAKAGGLGDVLIGLSRKLSEMGCDIQVILPKYDFLDLSKLKNLRISLPSFTCEEQGIAHTNTMWSAEFENCKLLLLEARHPKKYFERKNIYGYEDDTARMLYFSKASLEYIKTLNQPIDILHLHDWHTAIGAVLAKDLFSPWIKRSILTIHNADYQGLCATWDLDRIGLHGSSYLSPEKLEDSKHPHTLNLLKGGIVYADKVTTVSPTYAKELLQKETSHSLHNLFARYKEKISGILNGIDQTLWNPWADPYLNIPYTQTDSPQKISQSKEMARHQICKELGVNLKARPWIGSITRIVPQKGPELIEEGIIQTEGLGGSFILLGSSPIPSLQEHFNRLSKKYQNNPNVLFIFEYNETIAHKLYAALDFLLMPSIFEPCGLSQLIAMRYGTIPIVRQTGGLKDTIFDGRNGFVFQDPTKHALSHAIEKAFHLFRSNPTTFQTMAKQVMNEDFGWEKSAKAYLKLYTETT